MGTFELLGIMALTATIASYAMRQTALAIIGTLFWIVFAVQSYTLIEVEGDVYWAVFFGAMFVGLMSAIEPYLMREKKERPERAKDPTRMERRRARQEKRTSKYGSPMSDDQATKIRRRAEFARISNSNQAIVNAQRRAR